MIKRKRESVGSVVFDKRSQTWHYIWWEDGHRRSKRIGTKAELPSKAAARNAAMLLITEMRRQETSTKQDNKALTVGKLVELYRSERMPKRASTRRGYESWLQNHILPQWGDLPLLEVQARPVELWLHDLNISPKSKLHIRGMLSILWDYAMWRGDIETQRNPMELVTVKGATSKRVRKPRSLTVEEYHALLDALGEDVGLRTLVILAISFGLRVSEVFGLKWKDVDWLGKTITLERGVVKQIVDNVKSAYSAGTMVIADELLEMLKHWKQHAQFTAPEDWIFASRVKLGRQPLSYTHLWETLRKAAKKAGIGHVSSHTFRHTHRSWLDSVGTPVGVQQKLMRHADIRTTMNYYGDAVPNDVRIAHGKIVQLTLPRA